MNSNERIAAIIREVCQREELLSGLQENEDFFDHGVSSLAVIQMQIRIEEALKVTVPTSQLMAQPTINDWITLYTRGAVPSTEVDASADILRGVAQ